MLKNTIRLFLIQKDGTQVYKTCPPQDDGSIFLQQYKQKLHKMTIILKTHVDQFNVMDSTNHMQTRSQQHQP